MAESGGVVVTSVTEVNYVTGWDANAQTRAAELHDNSDPAYRFLTNEILSRISGSGFSWMDARILDAGCGVGVLSSRLAEMGASVLGVDPSKNSIAQIAVPLGATTGDLAFEVTTVEDLERPAGAFNVLIANMTLHSVPKLAAFMNAASRLLEPEGLLVVTIPNPDTYLQAREDVDTHGIDMRQEHTFLLDFRIRGHEPHPEKVIYFHRPFRTYLAAADAAMFRLTDIRIPDQVGVGKPRDVAVLEFRRCPINPVES